MSSSAQPPNLNLTAPGPQPGTLAHCLEPEVPAVLAVALLDKIVEVLGVFGLSAKRRTVVHGLSGTFLLLTLCVGALGYLHGGRPGLANLNALILLGFIAMLMHWARRTWWTFRDLSGSLDAIVADRDERSEMAARMERRLKWPPQLLLAGVTAVAGSVLGAFIAKTTGSSSISNWLFVPIDVVAVVLGVNVIYWLWIAVAWLSRFSRLKSIELAMDPETDPALSGSLILVRDVRVRVLGGLVMAELPPVILLIATNGGTLPLVACGVVLLLCLVTGIAIGVLPIIYVGRVRRTDRDNRVARLVDRYRVACREASAAARIELDRAFYQAVNAIRQRSVYPLNAESLSLIIATVVGPAVPFVLAVMIGVRQAS